MFTILHQEVTPEILGFFDLSKPTMPRAFNVLEGMTRGQIVVDDVTHPKWAVVREAVYGTLYFGGQIDRLQMETLFDHFFQFGSIGVGCWLDDALNQILPQNPDYDGFTLYFTERSQQVQLEPFTEQLPSGYTLSMRDENWFTSSFDYESTLASFGSAENALRHTFGVVLVQNATLICEAATGAPTHGRIEVGVTTGEQYRRRGFAGIACAKLIEICESKGYSTWWDCAQQNAPSTRLARKLGYQNEREYRYAWWEKHS